MSPMLSLYIMLSASLLLSGLTVVALTAVYRSRYGAAHTLTPPRDKPVSAAKFRRYAALNSVVSVSVVYGLTFVVYPFTFDPSARAGIGRILLEGVAILALYDVLYYLMHRYPFHHWGYFKRVHAVHHVVKAPSAIDSLYLHPLENFLGLALLWACAALVGVVVAPISPYAFVWSFALYSVLNIAIHSGLRLPSFPFAPINYLAERHQRHHDSMKATNFASVSPLPDLLFGTEVERSR
ncbi:MAG: sterol desaturase family protein [Myxococcales bacterium]|nr:sterol desaturase family protein [Myxococcales bacterium]